jgi:hypothetical protein
MRLSQGKASYLTWVFLNSLKDMPDDLECERISK